VPPTVTDIVVLNSGSSPLSGVNTVTASATVRVDESASNGHRAGQAIEPEPICRADTRTPCFFLGFGKSSNVGFLVGGVTPVCLTGIENLLPTRHLLCY
jgi:hypothetical protein